MNKEYTFVFLKCWFKCGEEMLLFLAYIMYCNLCTHKTPLPTQYK